MKTLLSALLLTLALASTVSAQEKGVDNQNERIKDGANNRNPSINGGKVDTGTGRGFDFGKGKTEAPPPVANPYRLNFQRDVLIKAAEELMRERKMIVDDAVSKPAEGILVSQPYTFTKGSVVSSSELNRLAEVPREGTTGWTRGRYTLFVEVTPIDGTSTDVSVNAKVEGRSDGVLGGEWITLRSNGTIEQEIIIALVERMTGGPPPGRQSQEQPPR
jgi:hypothetical protein